MVRRKSDGRRSQGPARRDKSGTHVLVSKRTNQQIRALREIRYYRNSVKLLIPRAPFARVVREIINDLFPNTDVVRIQLHALQALQEATEAYIVQFFEDCVLLSMHAKRVTLQLHDMILTRRLRGRDDVINR